MMIIQIHSIINRCHSCQLIFLFLIVFVLSLLISSQNHQHSNDLRFDSVHLNHQSSNHLLFFTPDIHGTTNDLALSFHSFNYSLYLFNSKCSLPRYSPLFKTTITPQQYLHSNNHQGEVIIPNRSVCSYPNTIHTT